MNGPWKNSKKYEHALEVSKDAGLLLARLGVGLMFFCVHGLPKIKAGPATWEKVGGAMAHLGVGFTPVFWGFMAAASECFGGLFLALGLLTRPAAAFMAFSMFVASVMHLTSGQGMEAASHAIENFFMLAAFVLMGAGRFSLDQKIFKGKF